MSSVETKVIRNIVFWDYESVESLLESFTGTREGGTLRLSSRVDFPFFLKYSVGKKMIALAAGRFQVSTVTSL